MRDFADKPTLTGSRIVLRPVAGSDVPGLRDLVSDPEGRRLTGTHADLAADEDALRAYYATRHEHADRLDLAIVEKASGEYAGEVVLNDLDQVNRSCGLRIGLRPGFRDRGLGSEAVRLVLEYAFDQVGLHRIALEVFSFNQRAQAVYERAGFVREGALRDALLWDGEFHDAIVMSILAHEWRVAASRPAP
jgi:RimJ/RimL family protein N-acetyltransferase